MKKIGIGISITLNVITVLLVYYILFGPGRNYILGQIYGAEIERKLSLFNELEIGNNDIVLLGDSLVSEGLWSELLPENNVINRGISGNSTIEVLARMDPIAQASPSQLFLMVGTNDIARGYKITDTVDNIVEIITRLNLKSPETEIFVQSILPSDASSNDTIKELNAAIKTAIAGKANWIDLYPLFLDERGNSISGAYSNDGIHLLGSGYITWRDALIPYIKEN